jgi:hypothetical protein
MTNDSWHLRIEVTQKMIDDLTHFLDNLPLEARLSGAYDSHEQLLVDKKKELFENCSHAMKEAVGRVKSAVGVDHKIECAREVENLCDLFIKSMNHERQSRELQLENAMAESAMSK